jgi:uncharacterized protein HemX
MDDQSKFECPPGPDRHSRRGRILVLTLLAVALVVPLGVYETIPVKQHEATAPPPDPTAQAIHDMQTSLQQALDQMKAIQQTVASDQAETKRLSGQGPVNLRPCNNPSQVLSRLLHRLCR